jgi:hypothetical protein
MSNQSSNWLSYTLSLAAVTVAGFITYEARARASSLETKLKLLKQEAERDKNGGDTQQNGSIPTEGTIIQVSVIRFDHSSACCIRLLSSTQARKSAKATWMHHHIIMHPPDPP